MTKFMQAFLAGLFALGAGGAQAALIDRGGGLIYDDVLGVTWLQNANLASTHGFGVSDVYAGGIMTWGTAQTWVAAANTANYLGFHDWRLPKAGPVNGLAHVDTTSFDGTTDNGYNLTAPGTKYSGSTANEMAHLFFNGLGNKSPCDALLSTEAICIPLTDWGLLNRGPFLNFPDNDLGRYNSNYWSGTEYSAAATSAWHFNMGGVQLINGKETNAFNVMLVRDGDVLSVPEPGTIALLALGLAGLGYTRRKQ